MKLNRTEVVLLSDLQKRVREMNNTVKCIMIEDLRGDTQEARKYARAFLEEWSDFSREVLDGES